MRIIPIDNINNEGGTFKNDAFLERLVTNSRDNFEPQKITHLDEKLWMPVL